MMGPKLVPLRVNEKHVSSRTLGWEKPATLVNRLRTRIDTAGTPLGDCVARDTAIDGYPYRLVRVIA